jgi:phage terminase large subunit-like protein
MRFLTIKRLAAATFVGGALTLAPIAMPAANAAPADCPNYAVTMTTQTSVSVSPSNLNPGQTFTATATVTTAGGVPVTGGSVEFQYRGIEKTDSTVGAGGTFSVTFTARKGRSPVVARFEGQCLAGSVASGESRDSAPVIAGVEASAGGGSGNGGGAGIGGVSGGSTIGGLAGTGMDTQTQLFGLLGVGMVTVGGLSLMVHRRRTQS